MTTLNSRYFYRENGEILKWVWCVFGCGPFKQSDRNAYEEINKSCYCTKCSKLILPQPKRGKVTTVGHPEDDETTHTHEEVPEDEHV